MVTLFTMVGRRIHLPGEPGPRLVLRLERRAWVPGTGILQASICAGPANLMLWLLSHGATMRGVQAASGGATVPQVFVGGKLVGGSDQLAEFLGHTP